MQIYNGAKKISIVIKPGMLGEKFGSLSITKVLVIVNLLGKKNRNPSVDKFFIFYGAHD